MLFEFDNLSILKWLGFDVGDAGYDLRHDFDDAPIALLVFVFQSPKDSRQILSVSGENIPGVSLLHLADDSRVDVVDANARQQIEDRPEDRIA